MEQHQNPRRHKKISLFFDNTAITLPVVVCIPSIFLFSCSSSPSPFIINIVTVLHPHIRRVVVYKAKNMDMECVCNNADLAIMQNFINRYTDLLLWGSQQLCTYILVRPNNHPLKKYDIIQFNLVYFSLIIMDVSKIYILLCTVAV